MIAGYKNQHLYKNAQFKEFHVSDKDCPVPEPFSGAFGSILFLTLLFFLTFIAGLSSLP
jgi:hypothetical protein